MVVARACLSNNGRISLSRNFDMAVVGVCIDETIGRNGVPSYQEKEIK